MCSNTFLTSVFGFNQALVCGNNNYLYGEYVKNYWSINSPLRYLRGRTKKQALVMIVLAWLASSSWLALFWVWWGAAKPGELSVSYVVLVICSTFQDDVCKTEFAANVPFKVISAIFNFYIPTTCMVVLYVRIFLAIKDRSREMEMMTAIQGLSVFIWLSQRENS